MDLAISERVSAEKLGSQIRAVDTACNMLKKAGARNIGCKQPELDLILTRLQGSDGVYGTLSSLASAKSGESRLAPLDDFQPPGGVVAGIVSKLGEAK